jgi:hypothetical protein
VQEELQRALEHCKVVEEERDALKKSLKEEEVLRVAAEGRIALPTSQEDDDDLLLMSPSKSPMKSPRKMQRPVTRGSDSEKENVQPMRKSLVQLKALQEELALERRLRQKAVDQIDFMKMECQFQSCSCRLAEQRGKKYVHDATFVHEMEKIKSVIPTPAVAAVEDAMDVDVVEAVSAESDWAHAVPISTEDKWAMAVPLDTPIEQDIFSPELDTFRKAESHADEVTELKEQKPARQMSRYSRRTSRRESMQRASPPIQEQTLDVDESHAQDHESTVIIAQQIYEDQEEYIVVDEPAYEGEEVESTPIPTSPVNTSVPETPTGFEIRTVTTTTTIPMQFSPVKQPLPVVDSLPATPRTISHPPYYHAEQGINDENRPPPTPNGVFKADGTIDRAAALEMINQRRVRARSMHLGQATPKKQSVEGTVRRDVSAPNAGATKGNGWKQ